MHSEDLQKLLIHFNKYSLRSEKAVDLYLFKRVIELIKNKTHVTEPALGNM